MRKGYIQISHLNTCSSNEIALVCKLLKVNFAISFDVLGSSFFIAAATSDTSCRETTTLTFSCKAKLRKGEKIGMSALNPCMSDEKIIEEKVNSYNQLDYLNIYLIEFLKLKCQFFMKV